MSRRLGTIRSGGGQLRLFLWNLYPSDSSFADFSAHLGTSSLRQNLPSSNRSSTSPRTRYLRYQPSTLTRRTVFLSRQPPPRRHTTKSSSTDPAPRDPPTRSQESL